MILNQKPRRLRNSSRTHRLLLFTNHHRVVMVLVFGGGRGGVGSISTKRSPSRTSQNNSPNPTHVPNVKQQRRQQHRRLTLTKKKKKHPTQGKKITTPRPPLQNKTYTHV